MGGLRAVAATPAMGLAQGSLRPRRRRSFRMPSAGADGAAPSIALRRAAGHAVLIRPLLLYG